MTDDSPLDETREHFLLVMRKVFQTNAAFFGRFRLILLSDLKPQGGAIAARDYGPHVAPDEGFAAEEEWSELLDEIQQSSRLKLRKNGCNNYGCELTSSSK